ncbi:hypothetical protein [Nocardia phage P3.1]|nr:hypothetical protein [Nocardia phage P3.1]
MRIRITGTPEEIADFLRRLPDIRYETEEIVIGANVQADFKGHHYQFLEWKSKR